MTRFQQVVMWSLVLLVLGYLGRHILVVEARQFVSPGAGEISQLQPSKKPSVARPRISRPPVTGEDRAYSQIDLDPVETEASEPTPNFKKGPQESFSLFASRNAQKIEAAAKRLREATTEDAKSIARTNLRKVLAGIFAADMDARRAQSHEIEAKLLKLRQQLSNREKAKEHIIDLQMEVLENDAGLEFSSAGASSLRRDDRLRGPRGYDRYSDDRGTNRGDYDNRSDRDSYSDTRDEDSSSYGQPYGSDSDNSYYPDEGKKSPEPVVDETSAGPTLGPEEGKKAAELVPDESASGKQVSPEKSP
jgi:hypothetical protein